MFSVLRSVVDGIKDEYRGWHKFRGATGTWPLCSIFAGILSIPVWFAVETYFFIVALETHRLPLIYAVLFAATTCGAAACVWAPSPRLQG